MAKNIHLEPVILDPIFLIYQVKAQRLDSINLRDSHWIIQAPGLIKGVGGIRDKARVWKPVAIRAQQANEIKSTNNTWRCACVPLRGLSVWRALMRGRVGARTMEMDLTHPILHAPLRPRLHSCSRHKPQSL